MRLNTQSTETLPLRYKGQRLELEFTYTHFSAHEKQYVRAKIKVNGVELGKTTVPNWNEYQKKYNGHDENKALDLARAYVDDKLKIASS